MLISNTSTLILLARISCLRMCLENYGEVEIPKAVYDEFIVKDNNFDTALIQKEIERKKISVINKLPKGVGAIMKEFRLDKGEAATCCLYNSKKHKAVLTDDGELIKLCKLDRIPFICAIAVVLKLFEDKHLPKEEALEKMKKLMIIGRYSREIVDYFVRQVK